MTKHYKAAKTVAVSFSLLASAILPLMSASPARGAPNVTPPQNLTAVRKQTIDTSTVTPPIPDPSGIVLLSGDTLLISDSEVEEINVMGCAANYANVNLWTYDISSNTFSASGSTTAPSTPDYSPEPTGLGLHEDGTLLVSDDVQDDIDRVSAGPGGSFGDGNDTIAAPIQTQGINNDIEGATWDSRDDVVWAIAGEQGGEHLYKMTLTGTVLADYLLPEAAVDTPGVVYHPGRDTLLVTDDSNDIFEIDKFGHHISTIDLGNLPGSPHTIQGITLAPGSGGESGETHLWIADRRADPGEPDPPGDPDPQQQCINDGEIHEFEVTNFPDDRDPTVAINTPTTGSTFAKGTNISFSGVASDDDGDITSSLVWTSSRDGTIGNGFSFSKVLSPGTHTITATAEDSNNNTAFDTINLTVSADPIGMTPGVTRGNIWYFNNGFDGAADFSLAFGRSTDKQIPGDWNGDGVFTPGIVRGNLWYLSNDFNSTGEIIVNYGRATDTHLTGDFDNNGTMTPVIVRGNLWYFNNGFDGAHDFIIAFGRSTDKKVVGDWDGNGTFTPGIVRGNLWYLSNDFNSTGEIIVNYGKSTDTHVPGDWDGNGTFTPGIIRGNVWYLNNGFDGAADRVFAFARSTDGKIAGDWNG